MKKRKSGDDPLIGFGVSEHVASFLLHEAFQFAHQAAAYEVAGELFGERIESIEPEPGWQMPTIPEELTDWLASRDEIDERLLDPATLERMAEAWVTSQQDAYTSGRKIQKMQELRSITDIVGHVINLGTCIEAVINRHLFLLRESGKLTPDHYIMLDRTEVLPKILFSFKDEIAAKKLHVSRLKYLVSLRNQAVHFRTSSADALAPTCEDLLEVWREVGTVFSLVEGEPTKEDVNELIKEFKNRWVGQPKQPGKRGAKKPVKS
jgi:hypothetical protein